MHFFPPCAEANENVAASNANCNLDFGLLDAIDVNIFLVDECVFRDAEVCLAAGCVEDEAAIFNLYYFLKFHFLINCLFCIQNFEILVLYFSKLVFFCISHSCGGMQKVVSGGN